MGLLYLVLLLAVVPGLAIYLYGKYGRFLVATNKLVSIKIEHPLGFVGMFLPWNMPKAVTLTEYYYSCLIGIAMAGWTGYGVFWLGPLPYLLTNSPKYVEGLLSSVVNIAKSNIYTPLLPWLKTGLLTSTSTKWRSRRKMITPAFHFRILDRFLPIMEKHSRVLVRKIREKGPKAVVDILHIGGLYTLDTILETSMGVELHCLEGESEYYVKALHQLGIIVIERVLFFWYWIDAIFYLTPKGRKFNHYLNYLHNFTRKVIVKRKQELLQKKLESPSSREDIDDDDGIGSRKKLSFLDILLEEHFKDSGFTEDDIREEVDTFTFEGNDTTASGIGFTSYLLGLHPEIQEKAREEVDDMFNGLQDGRITSDDLKMLKYLDCVIKETLRIYPPVPIIGRTLDEDIKIEEEIIPKGTNFIVIPAAIHMNPKVFSQPFKFDPDRFLPENCLGRHPYAYIPFSAGPRNCVGQRFAMNEMKICMCYLLRNFKLKALYQRDEIQVEADMIMKVRNGLQVEFQERTLEE